MELAASCILGMAWVALSSSPATAGVEPYSRVGYRATLSTIAHGVSGVVTIVQGNRIRIDNFHYDGGGISVYVYLAESNTQASFVKGFRVGPQLQGTAYNNGTLVIQLPAGHSLDEFHAVSIWCETANVNFGSGAFEPPEYPRAGYSVFLPVGGHSTSGLATIVDERTIRLDNFSYDGAAPAVYAYAGLFNTYTSFRDGVRLYPRMTRAYQNETLFVALPEGQSLSGYQAISIWCETFRISFTSGAFPRAAQDIDVDGDIDHDDMAVVSSCLSGPNSMHNASQFCWDADINDDFRVDLRDVQALQNCFSGDGLRSHPACAN